MEVETWEWYLAILLTLLGLLLHYRSVSSMGPLWRDEVALVAIDSLPTYGDVWDNMKYDSVLFGFHVILRTWLDLGLGSDFALRAFGLLVGLLALGALWLNARAFKYGPPLISLVLIGFNVTIIRWGETIRGHGTGLLFVIGLPASIWLLASKPTWPRFALAMVISLLAVHIQIYNAVILFALGSSAIVVAWLSRNNRGAVAVLLVGILSALSMLIYAPMIHDMSQWNMVYHGKDPSLSHFLVTFSSTIGPNFVAYTLMWIALLWAGAWFSISMLRRRRPDWTMEDWRPLYFLLAFAIGIVSYFLFLLVLRYGTSPWYYIALLGFSALMIEGMIASMVGTNTGFYRAIVVTILGCVWFLWAWTDLPLRISNMDLVARELQANTKSGDLIVINPWECNITLQRYYKGTTPWMTVPSMPVTPFHRFDRIKDAMVLPDQRQAFQSVIDRAEQTLRHSGTVWVIGDIEPIGPGLVPAFLPPAPNSEHGWYENAYMGEWEGFLAYFLQQHCKETLMIGAPTTKDREPIFESESEIIYKFDGWHD